MADQNTLAGKKRIVLTLLQLDEYCCGRFHLTLCFKKKGLDMNIVLIFKPTLNYIFSMILFLMPCIPVWHRLTDQLPATYVNVVQLGLKIQKENPFFFYHFIFFNECL